MKKLGILILWLSLVQIGKAQLNIAYDWYDYEEGAIFLGGEVVGSNLLVNRYNFVLEKDTLTGSDNVRNNFFIQKISLQGEVLDSALFVSPKSDSTFNYSTGTEINHVFHSEDSVYVFQSQCSGSVDGLKCRVYVLLFDEQYQLKHYHKLLSAGKYYRSKFIGLKGGGFVHLCRNPTNSENRLLLRKYKSTSEQEWEVSFKPKAAIFTPFKMFGLGLSACANGDILVSGFWEAGHPDGSGFLARINQQGVVWEKELDAPNEVWEKVFENMELPNGNIVLCEAEHYGDTKTGITQHARIRIYDANGELIKSHTIPDVVPFNSKNFYKNLLLLKNGDFIAVGTSRDRAPDQQFNEYMGKVLVSRYTASGEHLWSKRYYHPEFAHSYCDMFVQAVLEDPHNDSIMLLGHLLDISTGHRKPWFMKMDKDGLLIPEPDAVEEITPLTISLYPNPNSGNFMLRSHVVTQETYRILNLQGQVLHEGKLTPFEQKAIQLHLPAGLYVFSTTTHKQTFTVE